MGIDETRVPNNSITGEYTNFVYPKYLRNCGFALRAVPNGIVPSIPNKYVTMLQNSQKENGKMVFGNKTATPSATLHSHSDSSVRGVILRVSATPNSPIGELRLPANCSTAERPKQENFYL